MFIARADEATAAGDTAAYLEGETGAWGFLPDYAHCFAGRPEVATAWRNLNLTIREGMDRRTFEIATIAAARARRSTYCTAAHTMFLRDICSDEESVRAIDADPAGGALGERDAAVYRYATKVATDAASVTQADVDELRRLGLGDQDVADLAYAVGARLFFTAVLDGLGAQLDRATADRLGPDLMPGLVVGRPVGE